MKKPGFRDPLYTAYWICRQEGYVTLYFAYTAMLDPARISDVAPGAEFRFIAHLPEIKLVFARSNGSAALPSLIAESGNTVWGGVFEVPARDLGAIDLAEAQEGRRPASEFLAVDRAGKRHRVRTHVHPPEAVLNGHAPEREYMERVIAGGRHWGLPTGWVIGLEEYTEKPLF